MTGKRIIIRCAGVVGRKALEEYGKERVAYFCDNNCSEKEIEGVPVITTDKLRQIHKDYEVVIALLHMEGRLTVFEQLKSNGIRAGIYGMHEKYGIPHRTIHIYGRAGDYHYDFNDNDLLAKIDRIRADNTIAMYKTMLKRYESSFQGKRLDIHICIDDDLQQAYEFSRIYGYRYIFCYSTVFALSDIVIPIPDYRSCFDENNYFYKDAIPDLCRKAASKKYEDERAYWIGSMYQSDGRENLWVLSKKYPNRILAETSFEKKVPMPEQAKYKYLIDVRGLGWTDRVKTLLMLGRPLLLVDRPNREWYMDEMVPMKHYVPVKEDLSDLIEKIDYLDENPEVYRNIVESTKEFVDIHLNPDRILEYLRDVTLKYAVLNNE